MLGFWKKRSGERPPQLDLSPPVPFSAIMRAVCRYIVYSELPAALELAGITQGIAVTTEDFAEATKAFREKREPVYEGR